MFHDIATRTKEGTKIFQFPTSKKLRSGRFPSSHWKESDKEIS